MDTLNLAIFLPQVPVTSLVKEFLNQNIVNIWETAPQALCIPSLFLVWHLR